MAGQAQPPKSKLIETAATLIYRQGWNATGINQILGDAQVPKGSFYYYFQSKEDLGVAIVRHHAERLQESYERTLLNVKLSGRQGITKFFHEQVDLQRRNEWRYGCPVGSFSNEVAATSDEKIAAACREAMDALVAAFEAAIKRGQGDGTIRRDRKSLELAYLTAGLWEGGLLFMKTLRNERPLTAVIACLEDVLFKTEPAARGD